MVSIVSQNLISETIQYLNQRFAGRIEYAKGVALSLASTVAVNSVRTDLKCPVQTRSGLYILICGPSSTGKSSVINYGLDILKEIKYVNIISDDITTEAIPAYLSVHPYALMRMPEFSQAMGSYKKKLYKSGLREMLVKMWDGEILTQNRAGRSAAEAKEYCVTLIADTQPLVIADEASETDVQSGFLPRFFFFHEKTPPSVTMRNMTDDESTTRSTIIEKYKFLYKIAAHNDFRFSFSNDQLRLIDKKIKPLQIIDDHHFQPFYERMTIFALKLAMLHQFTEPGFAEAYNMPSNKDDEWGTDTGTSISRKIEHVEVEDSSVDWAIAFIEEYVTNNLPLTLRTLKLSDADKVINAIDMYRQEHNDLPMPESFLYRKLVHIMKEPRRIASAIELAVKMNEISKENVQGGCRYWIFDKRPKELEKYEDEVVMEDEEE
jgi:hypothetical protein